MKKVFFLLSMAALAYGSTSCKKCIECSYPSGGATINREICGSSTAVENAKSALNLEVGADSTKVVCVDK
jgi:hypothetical protein